MEFSVLGPFEAAEDGHPAALGGPKQRAVLAILLLNRGTVLDRARLIDELWGDAPPATADKTLQVYISNLRKALGDGLLVTSGRGYLLDVDGAAVDLDRFEQLAADGARLLADGDPEGAATSLRDALALWRGLALADLAGEGLLVVEAARLEEARLAANETRIEAELALGRHAALVSELAALVAEHPLRERLREQLMLALYRSGRQAEALEAYREARRVLVDQLGIEPNRRLHQLHEAMLRQDPALEVQEAPPPQPARRPSPTALPPPAGRRPARGSRTRRIAIGVGAAAVIAAGSALAFGGGGGSGIVPVRPNSVAVIDPGLNRVTDQIDVGSTPTVIAAGADGVWVLNANEETVTRIDPDTRKAERTIGTRGTPTDLAVSKEAVWVVNRPADLVRIDSGSGTLVRRVEVPLAEPPPRFSIPVSAFVATSPDAIWVSANATVARVDPRSTRLTLRRAVALAAGEVAVGEGALWVGGLARLDTRTARLTGSTKLPFEPADLAVGGGAVWLANQESDTVWRVDPRELVVRRVVRVGEHPAALAFGEGSLWVASLDGTVSRIDPETNRVAATIRVGGTPRGIATGHGMVWVAVS